MHINYKKKPNPVYKPIYKNDWSELVLIGGRGSGKSYEASDFAMTQIFQGKRGVILRDVAKTIKESIFTEITQRFDKIQSKLSRQPFDILESEIKKNGQTYLFCKGMRKSRVEQMTDLKGLSDVDFAILEEVEDIRDVERVDTLVDTLRKENVKIVFILNTPDVEHWIIKRYFDLEPAKVDGRVIDNFFSLVPKKIEGVLQIFSTYLDNPKLNSRKAREYANYANPNHYKYNLDHYYSDILGFARALRKGIIFTNWEIIEDDDFDRVEATSKFGQDYGSNDPSTLIETKVKENCLYIKEHFYLTDLTINQIYENSKHVTNLIKGDGAAKQTILSLNDMGLWVEPSIKGADSVEAGIRKIQSFRKVFICRSSINMQHEAKNYVWETDRNGKPTDKPKDEHNHGWDSVRYSLEEPKALPYVPLGQEGIKSLFNKKRLAV